MRSSDDVSPSSPKRPLKLARVAALAGADFDADVAAAVLDAHPLDLVAPWRELDAAQVLSAGRFSHDLVAESIVRALPSSIADALHARLAASLVGLGRSAARVAPHWAAASAWSRAGEAYAVAARDARRASRRSGRDRALGARGRRLSIAPGRQAWPSTRTRRASSA